MKYIGNVAKPYILEDVQWEGGITFEELKTWGLDPIRDTLERLDQDYGKRDSIRNEWEFYYYDLRTKIERLNRTLQRLMREVPNLKKQEAA